MILKQLKYGAGIFALLSITACTDEETVSVASPNMQEAVLSARKSHIITRAGDEVKQFDEDTKYLLYAYGGNEWLLYNTEGTEQANHTIGYGSPLVYDDTSISIYGVTYGKTDSPNKAPENTPLGVPMIAEKVTNNSLSDLMFSNNLIDQTVENGYRLEMDFKHAMSKVEFMIVKQDESEDTDKKLEGVTLKDITVKGTHRSGTFDIVKGKWNYGDSDELVERNYFSGKQDITTTSTKVSGELLLFPNADNKEVSISVTLGNLEGEDKEVEYKLRKVDEEGNDVGVFQFEVNHQYTLLITVLKDEVRTIAIAPQVYDWIDVNRDVNYLGQPVTFANLMWMDRNLGATSADCENDWEACRGYYYQYARNIPYILDKEKYDAAPNKIPVYPFLYTYNQYGEKVYSVDDVQTTVLTSQTIRGRKKIAVNPGEDGEYRFISDVNNGGYWMLDENGQEESFINEFWTSSVENHPCPKGWRLPTKEDFASFMPDITLNAPWSKGFNSRIYNGAVLGIREQLVYGEIGDEKAMYLIKRQGHPDCYRIRILMKESKESGKWYFEFAYFSGDPTMTFEDLTTEEKFLESMTNRRFDWSTPTAIMEVPACGFIHPSTENRLNGDGINALLRADEPNEQYNWICYLRDDNYQFGLIKTSRKALGDQIRCVRDVTAK